MTFRRVSDVMSLWNIPIWVFLACKPWSTILRHHVRADRSMSFVFVHNSLGLLLPVSVSVGTERSHLSSKCSLCLTPALPSRLSTTAPASHHPSTAGTVSNDVSTSLSLMVEGLLSVPWCASPIQVECSRRWCSAQAKPLNEAADGNGADTLDDGFHGHTRGRARPDVPTHARSPWAVAVGPGFLEVISKSERGDGVA